MLGGSIEGLLWKVFKGKESLVGTVEKSNSILKLITSHNLCPVKVNLSTGDLHDDNASPHPLGLEALDLAPGLGLDAEDVHVQVVRVEQVAEPEVGFLNPLVTRAQKIKSANLKFKLTFNGLICKGSNFSQCSL